MATTTPAVDEVVVPSPRAISVDEYARMREADVFGPDARVELIEGVIFTMSPLGGPHMYVVDRLTELLILGWSKHLRVSPQNAVRLLPLSAPEPDLMLVRRESFQPRPLTERDVLLVIEVADTTLAHDRDRKAPLYARYGIPELWIVAINEDRLLRYTEPRATGYQRLEPYGRGQRIVTTVADTVVIDLAVDDFLPPPSSAS